MANITVESKEWYKQGAEQGAEECVRLRAENERLGRLLAGMEADRDALTEQNRRYHDLIAQVARLAAAERTYFAPGGWRAALATVQDLCDNILKR